MVQTHAPERASSWRADIATGRGSSLGLAWRAGLHFCWRYVGLGLALLAIVLPVAAAAGVLFVIAITRGVIAAGATPGDGANAAIVVALPLIGIPLVLAGIAGGVVFSIVAAYAQRSVAIEDSRWGLESARGADLRCVAVTNTYSAAELRPDAELVVAGLHALTLEALDGLCAD